MTSIKIALIATVVSVDPRDAHRDGARPLPLPRPWSDEPAHLPADDDARDRARRVAAHALPEPRHRARVLDDRDRAHHVLHQLRRRHRAGAPRRGSTGTSRRRPWTSARTRSSTFYRITLPLIAPGILAGALLAFSLSDRRLRDHELQLGHRRRRSRSSSGARARRGVPPQVNVIGTMIFGVDRRAHARERPHPVAPNAERSRMTSYATGLSAEELQRAARDHLWLALHAHGRLPRRRDPDHRPRRRLLPRGRERQALPRRARRALRRADRLLARRGDRRGGRGADARAALLHELVVRAPARDRAGRPRSRRSRRAT